MRRCSTRVVARKRKDADNRFRSRRRHALKNLGATPLAEIRALGTDHPTPKRGFAGTIWPPRLAPQPPACECQRRETMRPKPLLGSKSLPGLRESVDRNRRLQIYPEPGRFAVSGCASVPANSVGLLRHRWPRSLAGPSGASVRTLYQRRARMSIPSSHQFCGDVAARAEPAYERDVTPDLPARTAPPGLHRPRPWHIRGAARRPSFGPIPNRRTGRSFRAVMGMP